MNAREAQKDVARAGRVSRFDSEPKPGSAEAKQHDRNLAKVEAEHKKAFSPTVTVRRG